MHHQHPELDVMNVRQRYDEYVAEAAQDRLVRQMRAGQATVVKRLALRFGKSLVRFGAKLMRYGKVARQSRRVLVRG